MKAELLLFLAVSPLVWASIDGEPPVVTTSQGRIIGTTLEFNPIDPGLRRSVHAFIGIPYAEPPVGSMRFKPPVAKSWSGEIKATGPRNVCPQPIMPLGNFTIEGPFSEDCLVLDVFVPQAHSSGSAVLVFIHGGGYMMGSGIMLDIFPTPIAAVGDVIVVTLNYRLGPLGFLSTNDDTISSNVGLLDQRLALLWVQDNIKAFGGDPERVAIFGESAGGGSVGLHMVSPGSSGLFRGAIMQSGDAAAPWATMPAHKVAKAAFALGKLVGCERETSQDLIDCLRDVDSDVLIEKQNELMQDAMADGNMIAFGPVVDGDFLPSTPDDLYAKGAINDAVCMIGSLSDEGMMALVSLFPNNTDEAPLVDSAMYDAYVPNLLGWVVGTEPIVFEMAKLMYSDASCKDLPQCNYLETLSQAVGDVMFVCPGGQTAIAFTKAGRAVYRYLMDHVSSTSFLGTKWSKAIHGDDVPFVFGLPLLENEKWTFTEEEAQLSMKMIHYWANLAKTGNPNLASYDSELTAEDKKTEWPLFTVEDLAYKILSPALQNGRALKAKECAMWNEFIPNLIKIAEETQKCRQTEDVPRENGEDDKIGTCTKDTCP